MSYSLEGILLNTSSSCVNRCHPFLVDAGAIYDLPPTMLGLRLDLLLARDGDLDIQDFGLELKAGTLLRSMRFSSLVISNFSAKGSTSNNVLQFT